MLRTMKLASLVVCLWSTASFAETVNDDEALIPLDVGQIFKVASESNAGPNYIAGEMTLDNSYALNAADTTTRTSIAVYASGDCTGASTLYSSTSPAFYPHSAHYDIDGAGLYTYIDGNIGTPSTYHSYSFRWSNGTAGSPTTGISGANGDSICACFAITCNVGTLACTSTDTVSGVTFQNPVCSYPT